MKTDGIFCKLMMMTHSNNDAEALTALRKANKILADAKVNWAELLGATKQDQSFRVPPSKRPRPEPEWEDFGESLNPGGGKRFTKRYVNANEIDAMFERVLASNMNEGFESFVTSVHLWWEQRGYLTESQYKAIKQAAEKTT